MAGLTGGLEEKILTLLCWHTDMASSIVMDVQPSYFSTRHYRIIAKEAMEYVLRYGQAPGNHLPDLLEFELSKGEHGTQIWHTISRMEQLREDINYAYVLDELNEFVANRKLAKAMETASDLLHHGKRDEALEALYKLDFGADASAGIWSNESGFLSFLDKEDEEDRFTLGIEALDSRRIRPARKTLFLILAPKKRGKSMALVQIGKEAAFVNHQNVLHITLEMSEQQTAKRYVQAICGWTDAAAEERMLRIPMFRRDDAGNYTGMDFQVLVPEALDRSHRSEAAERIKAASRGQHRLLIKEFPPRALTTAQLVMFLERLRRREKFVPDLLIIDYANEMAMNAANIRTETGRIFRDLRGIAVARNMAVVTATQGNRISDSAKLVGATHVAEDWSSMGTADIVISICRTAEEKLKRFARLYVAAARSAPDQFLVWISQSYETCQFCVDSIYLKKADEHEIDRLLGDEDD